MSEHRLLPGRLRRPGFHYPTVVVVALATALAGCAGSAQVEPGYQYVSREFRAKMEADRDRVVNGEPAGPAAEFLDPSPDDIVFACDHVRSVVEAQTGGSLFASDKPMVSIVRLPGEPDKLRMSGFGFIDRGLGRQRGLYSVTWVRAGGGWLLDEALWAPSRGL